MKEIIEEITLRAYQERAVSRIGRTTKAKRDAHEHAAIALENLAADIARNVTATIPCAVMEPCTHCAGTGKVPRVGYPLPRVFRWKDYKLTRES